MCGGLLAVYERDDVRMLETLENLDFGGEVVFELLVEPPQGYGFDGDI
jgi:hypothetical protein